MSRDISARYFFFKDIVYFIIVSYLSYDTVPVCEENTLTTGGVSIGDVRETTYGILRTPGRTRPPAIECRWGEEGLAGVLGEWKQW